MKKIFFEKMPTCPDIAFHIDSQDYNILHNHEYFEIALTNEGSVLHTVNNKQYVVNKKQLILLAPKDVHLLKNNNSNNAFSLLNLQISVGIFKKICDVIEDGMYDKIAKNTPYCFELSEFLTMQVQEYIEKAQHFDFTDPKRRLILISVVIIIISEIVRNQFWEKRYGVGKTHKVIELFFMQINDKNNIGKSFSEICETIPYHKSHIMRVFKQNNMEAPNKIFIRHKMRYAVNLLLTTDMKIIDICNMIGYGSLAYFNKTFKAIYSCTPSEYKKNKR